MHPLKAILMRRRPSVDPKVDTSDTVPDNAVAPACLDLAPDAAPPVRLDTDWQVPRTDDLTAARAARDHVPHAPGPTAEDRPDWRLPEVVRAEQAREAGIGAASGQSQRALDAPPLSHGTQSPAAEPGGMPPDDPHHAPRPRRIWEAPVSDPSSDFAPREAPAAATAQRAEAAEPRDRSPQEAPPVPAPPRKGRVKTRLAGFHSGSIVADPLAAVQAEDTGDGARFPIGWLVVIDGPGRGAAFTLQTGLSTVGRGADQTVTLDFGDTSISRDRHAAVAYDDEDNLAYIGHGGKSNIVRVNDRPLLSTEPLGDRDTIRIGKTTLRYFALCDETFSWAEPQNG